VSNFRIGEGLPDPVTPLFGDWLLQRLDEGFRRGMQETAGATVPFSYALINGWYYTRPNPSPSWLPTAIVGSHGRLVRFLFQALIRPGRDPQGTTRRAGRPVASRADAPLPRPGGDRPDSAAWLVVPVGVEGQVADEGAVAGDGADVSVVGQDVDVGADEQPS
jgi:hypothetical protein